MLPYPNRHVNDKTIVIRKHLRGNTLFSVSVYCDDPFLRRLYTTMSPQRYVSVNISFPSDRFCMHAYKSEIILRSKSRNLRDEG